MRTMLLVVTAIGVCLAVTLACSRYLDSVVMRIEREAARERVLDTGSASSYDRELLGDDAESLIIEHQRHSTAKPR